MATRSPRRVIFIDFPTETMVDAAVTCAALRPTPSNNPPVIGATGGGVTGPPEGRHVLAGVTAGALVSGAAACDWTGVPTRTKAEAMTVIPQRRQPEPGLHRFGRSGAETVGRAVDISFTEEFPAYC